MFEDATSFRIEPGLSIARVGSSPDEFFLGPEYPGHVPNAGQPYKDAEGKVKRQAARFRVYAYDADGQALGEVTAEHARIEWRVHAANRKAAWYQFINAMDLPDGISQDTTFRNSKITGEDRKGLIIDAGVTRIVGTSQQGDAFQMAGQFLGQDVYLGELRTDDAGRLLVLGGRGHSVSSTGAAPTTFANNDGWHDDTSDGTVRATVRLQGQQQATEAEPAMYAAVPPNFAPGLTGVVTMHDVVTDLFTAQFGMPRPERPDFQRDIYPIFRRLSELEAVNHGLFMLFGWGSPMDFRDPALVARLSNPDLTERAFRQRVFAWFRAPDAPVVESAKLPPFYGDSFDEDPSSHLVDLHITPLQYGLMRQWADGDFATDPAPAVPASLDDIPPAGQPAALSRAALEDCLGGPFHPGIELTWTMRLAGVWQAPFRLRIAAENESPKMDYGPTLTPAQALAADGPLQACFPGTLTWWLGVPWQTDEASCDAGYTQGTFLSLPSFWAARVPNHVLDARSAARVGDSALPVAQRLKHLSYRQRWLRFLRAPYLQHIADMVTKWDLMGIVVTQETGPGGTLEVPQHTGVETEVAASLNVQDPTWTLQTLADSGLAAVPLTTGLALEAAGAPVASTRVTHSRDERG